jgi:hypothetical protein
MVKQRTMLWCLFANALLTTSISAAAFGRFRALSPSGRNHHEYERENSNDNDEEEKAFRKKNSDDLVDDKRRRQRQTFQRKQQQHKKESSWLDGMELEDDYHVPSSDHGGNDHDGLDHDDHHHALLDAEQTHPLLQIPCAMHVDLPDETGRARSQPVRTFCDTGAQRTVMSWDCASRTGLLQHLDRRYAGQAMGVGSCRVLGRIPAGIGRLTLNGQVSIPSPAITVLESTTGGSSDNNNNNESNDATAGVELLLGLDFLREHDAIINLRAEELQLIVGDDEEVRIPFIRPRSPSSSRGGGSARGGASAATGATTTRQRRSSDNDSDDACDDDYDDSYARPTKQYRRDEWEGEEDDDEDSDDMGGIDMSGV